MEAKNTDSELYTRQARLAASPGESATLVRDPRLGSRVKQVEARCHLLAGDLSMQIFYTGSCEQGV